MSQNIRVVAATIEQEGRYLITQRRPEAVLPLLWEFPGGRVEPEESDEQALERELKVRLNAEIEVGQMVSTRSHDYEGYSVTLVLFEARLISGELQKGKVHDFRWVAADEFDQYEFPHADQKTMDQLLGFGDK